MSRREFLLDSMKIWIMPVHPTAQNWFDTNKQTNKLNLNRFSSFRFVVGGDVAAAERATVADREPWGYTSLMVHMAAGDLFTTFIRPEFLHTNCTYVVCDHRWQIGNHHGRRLCDDLVVIIVVSTGEDRVEIEHRFKVHDVARCKSWSCCFRQDSSHGTMEK